MLLDNLFMRFTPIEPLYTYFVFATFRSFWIHVEKVYSETLVLTKYLIE